MGVEIKEGWSQHSTTPTFQHSISYLITPCARRSPSSAPLRPKRPPSTSSVCWPMAGASSRMLAGVLDR